MSESCQVRSPADGDRPAAAPTLALTAFATLGGTMRRDVAVVDGQLLDRARAEDEELGVGGHEDRLDSGVEALVHDRELEFVGKIGHAPHAADEDLAAVASGEFHDKRVAEVDGDVGIAAEELEEEVAALLGGEEPGLLPVDRDDDQELVEEDRAPAR